MQLNQNQIKTYLLQDISVRQISKKLGVSDTTIRKNLKIWNLTHLQKPVTLNNGAAKVQKKMTDNKSEILDLRDQGMGINKLAQRYGVSNSVIYKYLALWERPNAKHGLMIATYNRYIPKTLTEQDFAEEIKTVVYKNVSHGVSKCFPINSNCEKTIWH